jgi:ribonuclease P protein component
VRGRGYVVSERVATAAGDLDRCAPPGCRGPSRTRSIVRSRCAMTRPSNLHQIVSTWHCIRPGSRGGRREAYISTQHPPTCQEARVPLSHEHPRRPCRAQEPSRQGPRPTVGLIGRIRERHAFVRLGREGTRIRRSALWCIWCPDPDSTATSIAFAINRAYGPAVTRNRLRRRLRSILHELDRAEATPPALLLIGARPEAIELTFDQLRSEMTALIDQIRRQYPRLDHSA